MSRIISIQRTDRDVIVRMKEILCDFSREIEDKMISEKDREQLDHLEKIYNMIPDAQFVIGYALGSRKPS